MLMRVEKRGSKATFIIFITDKQFRHDFGFDWIKKRVVINWSPMAITVGKKRIPAVLRKLALDLFVKTRIPMFERLKFNSCNGIVNVAGHSIYGNSFEISLPHNISRFEWPCITVTSIWSQSREDL